MTALLLIFFQIATYPQATLDLEEIRKMYSAATYNESSCKKLVTSLQDVDAKINPIAAGYKACGMMMMAKYYINPVSKINTFNEGKELLNVCIAANNKAVELRFLRFAAQCEAPGFLGYDEDMSNDKALIIKSYPQLKDSYLKEMIRSYMVQCDQVLESEKKYFAQNE